MSSPGMSTGVRIGTRSKVRPSTTTVRGAGPGSVIAPMVPGAACRLGGCRLAPPAPTLRVPCRPSRMRPRFLRLAALAAVAGDRRPARRPTLDRRSVRVPARWARYRPAATTTSSRRLAATAAGPTPWSTRSFVSRRPTCRRTSSRSRPPASPAAGKVRAVVIDDLREMAEAATRPGTAIGVRSAYRSLRDPAVRLRQYVARDGYNVALHLLRAPRPLGAPARSRHRLPQRPAGGDASTSPGARRRRASGCAATPGNTASS